MTLRLCRRCYYATHDNYDVMLVCRALCETGQWRCPFGEEDCGKWFDKGGKRLALTQTSCDCRTAHA